MSPELSNPLDVIDVAQGPLSSHVGVNPTDNIMGLNNAAGTAIKDPSAITKMTINFRAHIDPNFFQVCGQRALAFRAIWLRVLACSGTWRLDREHSWRRYP